MVTVAKDAASVRLDAAAAAAERVETERRLYCSGIRVETCPHRKHSERGGHSSDERRVGPQRRGLTHQTSAVMGSAGRGFQHYGADGGGEDHVYLVNELLHQTANRRP